jgi:hypothetical protein
MKMICFLISLVALAGILIPAILLLGGSIDLRRTQQCMLISTVAWFVSAPFWLKRKGA